MPWNGNHFSSNISGQTTGLDHLRAHFRFDWTLYPVSILTVVYPKVVIPVVSNLTVVYILTVDFILSECSQQTQSTFLFSCNFFREHMNM